jgi:hypothetical protein
MKKIGISADTLKSKHSEYKKALEQELKQSAKILDEYKKDHGKLEVFFNRIIDNITPVLEAPGVYKPVIIKDNNPITAIMHITDGHMGAIQEPSEIEGFNMFNPAICDSRQIKYAQDFIKWITVQRFGYSINECSVIVTGDLISGDIHDELKITNAFPVTEQVIRAAELLSKQILLLAPHFAKINIEFITEDNHSRLTKKPQMKEAGMNSLNYLVGYIAKLYVAKQKNVEFNIYPKFEQIIHVATRNYLICHGHGSSSWMGVPWYSIERKMGKESQARMQLIMRDIELAKSVGFHKYIFGHYHTPIDTELYSGGGSVSGTDALDHKMGRYAKPSQPAWLVSQKHGEFNRINFNLE